jgi:hypothetical protein
MDNLLDFETVNDKICEISVKLKYRSLTLISILPNLKKKVN